MGKKNENELRRITMGNRLIDKESHLNKVAYNDPNTIDIAALDILSKGMKGVYKNPSPAAVDSTSIEGNKPYWTYPIGSSKHVLGSLENNSTVRNDISALDILKKSQEKYQSYNDLGDVLKEEDEYHLIKNPYDIKNLYSENAEKYIQGYSGLSEEEQRLWDEKHKDILKDPKTGFPASFSETEDLYWNEAHKALNKLLLKSPGGYDKIKKNLMSGKSSKDIVTSHYVDLATSDFVDELDAASKAYFQDLDADIKLDLAKNYLSKPDIIKNVNDFVESGRVIDDFDVSWGDYLKFAGKTVGKGAAFGFLTGLISGPVTGGVTTALSVLGDKGNPENFKYDAFENKRYTKGRELSAGDYEDQLNKRNAELFEEAIQKNTARHAERNSELINTATNTYLSMYANNKISKEDIDTAFSTIAENSPHYNAFKDRKEFEDYTEEDKVAAIARFQALEQVSGTSVAITDFNNSMQNWVDSHQGTWTNIWNTTKGLHVEAISSTASNILGIVSLFKDEKFLEGLDKEGNPLPAIFDPNFWNDAREFNTLDPGVVNRIRNSGGISPHTNITAVGEELKLLSWDAIGQSVEQSGQFAGMIAGRGISKIPKLLIKGGVGATKYFGVKYPTINTAGKMAKLGKSLDTMLEIGVTSAGPAFMEASEAYTTSKEGMKRGVDNLVENEVSEYAEQLASQYDFDPSDVEVINRIAQTHDLKGKKFEELSHEDQARLYDKSYREIAAEKQNEYLNLINNYRTRRLQHYEEDYSNIPEIAHTAYKTAFIINLFKTGITNATSRRWLFSKSSVNKMKEGFGITSNKTPSNTKLFSEMGGFEKAKHIGSITLKSVASEGFDERLDGIINKVGYYTGMSKFNNYIDDKYDSSKYFTHADTWFSNITNIWGNTATHFKDKELLYETWLGALSGGINVSPNIESMVANGFKPYTEEEYKKMAKGEKVDLSFIDKLSRYVSNSVISEIAENDSEVKNNRRIVKSISDLLSNNKDFNTVMELYSGLLEESNSEQNGSIKDLKDSRIESAIKLANALRNSKSMLEEYGLENAEYDKIWDDINNLASGKVSDELIEQFLKYKGNETIAQIDNNGNFTEHSKKEAKERLIHNATKLKNIIDNVNGKYRQEAEEAAKKNKVNFNDREDFIHNYIWSKIKLDDIEDRITKLSKELGVSVDIPTKTKAYSAAQNKVLEEEKNNLREDLEKTNAKIKSINDKLRKAILKGSKKNIALKLELEQELFNKELFEAQLSELEEQDSEQVLTESEITKDNIDMLAPSEIEFITDSKNKGIFSKKEASEIEKYKKKKLAQDKDFFVKLKDLNSLNNDANNIKKSVEVFSNNTNYFSIYTSLAKIKQLSMANKIATELVYENFALFLNELQKSKPNQVHNFIKKYVSSYFLSRYIEENNLQNSSLSELLDIVVLKEDIKHALNELKIESATKNSIANILDTILSKSKSVDDVMKYLEKVAQSEDPSAPIFNEILTKVENIGYTRNATVIESAEKKRKRKKKQEEKRKKEEERKNKKEEKPEEKITDPAEEVKISESIEIKELSGDEVKGTAQEESPEVISTQDIDITESPTIEEQVISVEEEHKDKVTLGETNDEDIAPTEVLQSSEMLGNAMYEYEGSASSTGTQKRRRGKKEDDRMSKFFDWTKAAGFTIQKTIDEELSRIAATNPDVMFMAVNPVANATKDADVKGHVFTVVEYTPEIKRIHTNEDGNVITAGDKKYLVIGTLGYADSNFTQRNLAGFVWSNITNSSKAYFKNNSSQRFYVDSTLKTKISGIDRGWLVNQLEEDDSVQPRSIVELINDPKRNPRRLKIEDLKWRIQIGNRTADINVTEDDIIGSFKSEKEQSGRTFLLVESSNGKYIPVAVRPTFFKEIKEGTLRSTIIDLASRLASGIPAEADRAYKDLRTKLVFNKDRKLVLSGNIIEEHFNGSVVRSFDVTSPSFSIVDLLGVLDNFRINITAPSLTSKASITELAEAGALNLDIATLSTSNAGYKLYGIDPDTKQPIISSNTNSSNSVDTSGDKFVLKDQKITHNGTEYTSKESGFYDKNGNLIRDPYLIEMLKIESIIKDTNPVKVNRDTEYYVLKYNNGNTFMVSRNTKTGVVVKVQASTKDRILNEIKEKERKNNAAEELKASEQVQKTQDQIVVAEESDMTLLEDILFEEEEVASVKPEEVKPAQSTTQESVESKPKNKSLEELKEDSATLDTVEKIIDDAIFGEELDSIIDEKVSSGQWSSVNSVDDLKSLLESKGMPTIGITDVRLWLDIIKECK